MDPKPTDIGELAGPLIASMPEATVKATETPKPPEAPAVSGDVDSYGRKFDPAKFRPEKDSLGRWKNLRGGRKPAVRAPQTELPLSSPSPAPDPAPRAAETAAFIAPDAPPPPPPDQFKMAAAVCVSAVQSVLVMVGQEEGLLEPAERAALAESTEAVLRKYEAKDIPPEAALAITVLGIVTPRLAKPKTQTTFQRIRAWMAQRWTGWQGARVARKVEQAQAV